MYSNTLRFSRLPGWLAGGALVLAATLNVAQAADSRVDSAADATKDAPQGAAAMHMDRHAQWAQHRQQWVHAKLERDANRLEIKASQQAAWQEYAKARTALAERQMMRPSQDLDAAGLAKLHADRVADAARKLAVLADATAKLEVVLSPDQRQTLDQMARHGHHRGHGHHEHGHGDRGGPGGHEGHEGHEGPRGDGPRAEGPDGDGAGPAPEAGPSVMAPAAS
jgi:hypothetical protein